jgi:hypothetical protein
MSEPFDAFWKRLATKQPQLDRDGDMKLTTAAFKKAMRASFDAGKKNGESTVEKILGGLWK